MVDISNTVLIPEVPHSIRGASGAHRWSKCPGSINLTNKLNSEGKKTATTSVAAAEGTVAHTVASTCLEDGSDGLDFLDMSFKISELTFSVDKEMADGVQEYLDFIRDILATYSDAQLYVEKSLSSMFDEDAWGTPDAVIIIPSESLIIVIDFKYGQGVVVEPDSFQNKYYGALALEKYGSFERVQLFISQPRIPHPRGTTRGWETTSEDIQGWFYSWLLPAMDATRDPNAPLMVGEHCKFCPARDYCPALKKAAFAVDPDLDPDYMTDDEIAEFKDRWAAIKSFAERVDQLAYTRMMNGRFIRGQKIVRKKANRIFKNEIVPEDQGDNADPISVESAAVALFGDDAYEPRKLKTPPQMEKIDHPEAKSFVARTAYKPDNGLTIAPNSDKRDAVRRDMERFMEMMDGGGDPDL